MFTQLHLRKFKAWRDTGPLRLAPITVLFGGNSAGKTSLLQSLLALKQTAESPDKQRVLNPGDRNTLVDVGTFYDVVHGHQTDQSVEFSFRWRLPGLLTLTDPLKAGQRYQGDELAFSAAIRSVGPRDILQVERMGYALYRNDQCQLTARMQKPENKKAYDLIVKPYELKRIRGRKFDLAPLKFYGFPDEVNSNYQNANFLSQLTFELEKLFSRLYYVGPLREYPSRSYVWSGEIPTHVGKRGETTVAAILAARDKELSRGPRRKFEPFEATVARWLKQMGLIEDFRVESIAKHRKDYEVRLRTVGNPSEVNLTDVGFGISQVLPVIIECFYVENHAAIIFEQPEIHLHPRVQADLADLFIEAIRTRSREPGDRNGKDRDIQIIVESHSEHFLRRLQRRIAEGETIGPKDVAIYFCERGKDGVGLRELELDIFGNISNWPENFFGDELGDLAAMTEAAMLRQMAGADS